MTDLAPHPTEPLDLDDLAARVNALYLELPGSVANDVLPRIHEAITQLREAVSPPEPSTPPMIRSEFMAFLRGGGSGDCPTCGRYAAIYKRGLNVSMARGLAAFAACFPINPVTGVAPWVDVPKWKATVGLWQSNDAAQLRHWGLIESKASVVRRSNMADDSPDRAYVGIWRLTVDGMRFAQGRLSVPRFAVQYDQNLIGLAGERITIREISKFTYEDLPVSPALLAALLSDA